MSIHLIYMPWQQLRLLKILPKNIFIIWWVTPYYVLQKVCPEVTMYIRHPGIFSPYASIRLACFHLFQ